MGGTGAGGAPHAGRGQHRVIDLALPQDTVQALAAGGYRLCLFKAVTCDLHGGRPLVWAATTAYRTSMTLDWDDGPYGYAATDEPGDGTVVRGSDQQRTELGGIVDVGGNAVTTADPRPGDPRFVTVLNTTTGPFTCGLAESAPLGGGAPAPYCAFPLYGGNLVFLAPLPRVALAFTSLPLAAGEAVRYVVGPTVLVDLDRTAGPAALGYDIDRGWSWRGPQTVPVRIGGLTDALIVPSG
jgi:hypothetical protein